MATEIIELELEELSLVDVPANPEAKVSLFKRHKDITKMDEDMKAKLKPYMDKGMTEEEAMKAYQEDMKKRLEKAEQSLEKVHAFLIDEGYKITSEGITKKAPEDFIEYEGERISKSDDRFELVKKLKEVELEKQEVAIEKKAKEDLPNWNLDAAKEVLKANPSDKLLEALKAADAAFEAVMLEKGDSATTDGDMTDPSEVLNKMAKDYAAEKGISFYKAYDEVKKTDAGLALYKKILKGE